jgi:hypothetical protein
MTRPLPSSLNGSSPTSLGWLDLFRQGWHALFPPLLDRVRSGEEVGRHVSIRPVGGRIPSPCMDPTYDDQVLLSPLSLFSQYLPYPLSLT